MVGLLVAGKIAARAGTQCRQNIVQVMPLALGGGLGGLAVADIGMARVAHQHRRHFTRLQNEIGVAGVDQVPRHRRIFGRLGILRDRHAAHGFDLLGARRAVAAHARHDDANRPLALLLGQRAEEVVDRPVVPRLGQRRAQMQLAVFNRERVPRPNDVHVVRFDGHAVFNLVHGHSRVLLQNAGHQAFAVRRQVLNEHKRDARVVGHDFEELDEGFQSAGRCADADYRKRQTWRFFAGHRLRETIVFFRRLLVGIVILGRLCLCHTASDAHMRERRPTGSPKMRCHVNAMPSITILPDGAGNNYQPPQANSQFCKRNEANARPLCRSRPLRRALASQALA